ncbi:MAG: acyltransferase family protein, partial [Verrucomicrobia bacterium]|nr:acyltransferase family protein [Verrucomicrobiota bacterium]
MSSDTMMPATSSTYRRDIDGLRGLSVLLVVLFHATGSVRGGFVGVDVFFVISGYLISGILLREMESGTFSFAAFWERRLRRIMPASVVMSLITLGLGVIILLPEDLVGLGRSLMAHTMMASNIYFWQDSGYFAAASDQKPLLHTWSLAVEEQFYLGFPILCWVIWRWCLQRGTAVVLREYFFKAFTVLMLFSFVVSVVMINRDSSAAFYLLPSRAWELLLGACLACCPPQRLQMPIQYCRALAVLGLGMILGCAIQYRDSMPFPGFLALPPCIGAVFLIWANASGQLRDSRFWLSKLMESRLLVGLGVISYSLYLWHWPFLAFWEYLDVSFSKATSHVVRLTLMLLALGLAYASWRWVETPFRKSGRVFTTRTSIFMVAVTSLVVLFGIGWAVYDLEGLPKRWPEKAVKFALAAKQMGVDEQGKANSLDAVLKMQPPVFGSQQANAKIHVVVWGDSHAMCISPALEAICKQKGLRGYLTAYGSTPPLLGFVQPSTNGLAKKGPIWGQAVLDLVKVQKIPHVLLVGYWQQYTKGRSVEFLAAMKETVDQFSKAGAKVWILKDVPTHAMIVPRALA